MVDPRITVVICTIEERADLLQRALRSVQAQTLLPGQIVVSYDAERLGHAHNRNVAMQSVSTEWVAFLDDDDAFLPNHLEHTMDVATVTGADVVYPWHAVIGPNGERLPDFIGYHGKEFDPHVLRMHNYIPITVLAKTEEVRRAGFPVSGPGLPFWKTEDWGCWLRMLDNGCTFVHTPDVTWEYHQWGGNQWGQPS